MTDPSAPEQPDRIIAHFDEPDPEVERLFISLGRAVTATAAMEQALQIYAVAELVELYEPTDPRFLAEITRFLKLTGGQVCKRMQKLGLSVPEHLAPPIDDAIDRRNALIHRSFRDLELARAAFENRSVDPLVERTDQLARDSAGLMFDLERRAVPKLSAAIGMSPHELLEAVSATDPEAVADPKQRQQLLDLQALAGLEGLPEAIATLTNPTRESEELPETGE